MPLSPDKIRTSDLFSPLTKDKVRELPLKGFAFGKGTVRVVNVEDVAAVVKWLKEKVIENCDHERAIISLVCPACRDFIQQINEAFAWIEGKIGLKR